MPPHQPDYLYGLHDPGGEHLMREAGCRGWILFTEAIGSDPNDASGGNYAAYAAEGFGVIVRLNNGYPQWNAMGPGTIPPSSQYESFARRCGAFAGASQGAHIWIIGNEMNMAAERPGAYIDTSRGLAVPRGQTPSVRDLRAALSIFAPRPRGGSPIVDPGEVITPALYARCYTLCRNAIRSQPGHSDDLVLIGSVAPWNDNTGDWVQYQRDILMLLGPPGCDGVTIHTYTHGQEPALVHNDHTMDPPYDRYHYNFYAYRDLMAAIPAEMRHLPVYITETDQNGAWSDQPEEWLRDAYAEIARWNRQPGNQQIRALILYRWQDHDQYSMVNKAGVHDALRKVMTGEHRWQRDAAPPVELPAFQAGTVVYAQTGVRVRQAPGKYGKDDDTIKTLAPDEAVTVVGPVEVRDTLTWWKVRFTLGDGAQAEGWAAQADADTLLLASAQPAALPRGAGVKLLG